MVSLSLAQDDSGDGDGSADGSASGGAHMMVLMVVVLVMTAIMVMMVMVVMREIIQQVSLRRKSDDFHFCGGSVLSSNAIVTGGCHRLPPSSSQ